MGRALRRRNGQAFSHTIFDMLFLLVKRACMRADGRGEGRAHTVLTRGETSGGEARVRTAGQAGADGPADGQGDGRTRGFYYTSEQHIGSNRKSWFFHTDSAF